MDDDHRAAHAGDQARRLARRRPAPPAVVPLLPAGARRSLEETSGTVLAGALAWGGNTRFAFERTTAPTVRAWCGHNPMAAEYVLDPGATFITPEQIWAWSTEGVGPLSRRLHRWVRPHAVRDGDELRPIVANNWEATFFSFDTGSAPRPHRRGRGAGRRAVPARRRLVRHVAPPRRRHGRPRRLAGRRGEAAGRPRSCDRAGGGARGPVRAVGRARDGESGLDALRRPSRLGRRPPGATPDGECRQQLVLDILQPDVAAFVLDVVDRTLAENPGISYLKWDANRPLTDPGSPALARDRQANYWVDHVRADLGPHGGGRRAPPRPDAHALRLGRRAGRPRVAALVPRGLVVGQHRSGGPGPHAVGCLALPARQRRWPPTSPRRRTGPSPSGARWL